MKKYYIHIDNSQQGPFDIEELKNLKIKTNTMIWYKGIENWKKAIEIPELKILFSTLPPPISKQEYLSSENDSKNSIGKILFTIAIVVLGVIGCLVVINILSNPTNNSFMNVTINPPNPRVVFESAGEDPTSTILNYRAGIDCTILNQGGKGSVLVSCFLYQGKNRYERSVEIFMYENETQKVHFTFDEAKLFGSKMEFKINVKAI